MTTELDNIHNKVLRRVEGGYMHWCPGCKERHVIPDNGWEKTGFPNLPTFRPSIRITWEGLENGVETRKVCHYFITQGKIEYCLDSTHQYKGVTGNLPPIPE